MSIKPLRLLETMVLLTMTLLVDLINSIPSLLLEMVLFEIRQLCVSHNSIPSFVSDKTWF